MEIKKENRGLFTKFAAANNMSVAEAAAHVMANKENYSPAKVKQAVFAHNAQSFNHAEGGRVGYGDGGGIDGLVAQLEAIKRQRSEYDRKEAERKAKMSAADRAAASKNRSEYYRNVSEKERVRKEKEIENALSQYNNEMQSGTYGSRERAEKHYKLATSLLDDYQRSSPKAKPTSAPTSSNAPDYLRGNKTANIPFKTGQQAQTDIQQQGANPVLGNKKPSSSQNLLAEALRPALVEDNENVQVPEQDLAQTAVVSTPQAETVNPAPGLTSTSPVAQKTPGKGFDWSSALNAGIDYGIPLLQTALGFKQLKKAGQRPVGQLDPDYLNSINSARRNVVTANTNAKYGYTPEEQALIDQRNNNLTSDARFAARNYSGGSSANAFNMERAAVNDSFNRSLEASVGNRQLQLAKQEQAYGRQGYLDNLIGRKADMSRQLFNDKMNAWQQNQQAGAGLLSAGLQNLAGANRYRNELKAYDQINQKYGV